MIIKGKRIRNIDKYLLDVKEGEKFYIGIQDVERYSEKLREYGLLGDLHDEHVFTPRPINRVSQFNANGRWEPDKSMPMEDRDFESEYHVVDWHGNDHYGIRYYTRKCYQRKLVRPPFIQLVLMNGLLISPLLTYTSENKSIILHVINLYLEIFGMCETFNDKYIPKQTFELKELTWTLLPEGKYPWEKAQSYLKVIIDTIPNKHRNVIGNRHKIITQNTPDFMAIGEQGFLGYVVYGFTNKNIFVFESNKIDNATYVFSGNWEEASKLTKAEILSGELHEARIFHNKNWEYNINQLLY